MKPDIILTFDYEIFFGEKSGLFENCLYYPVEKLREVMKENEIKGIFFVDILYYIKLCEYEELYEKSLLMKKQIQNLIKDGHRVELHLHPHWLNSEYIDKKWKFKYNKYRFDQLTIEERDYIFDIGVSTLKNIIKEIDKDYKLKGYRAGGWCIQPFDNFYPYFKKYNLEYDSSVIEGIVLKGEGHELNFTNVPKKQEYKFSKNIEIEEQNGEFVEYKISHYSNTLIEKIINRITALFIKNKQFGDGMPMKTNKKINLIERILNKLKKQNIMYNLEGTKNKKIFLKKILQNKNDKVIFLSHPKGMNNSGIELIKILKKEGYHFKVL